MTQTQRTNEATSIEEEQYDNVPYESYACPQSHPQQLNTVAKLFGLEAPNIKAARILEIGCASGGNIVPLAIQFPESAIVGIDISGKQIDIARAIADDLKLKNISFLHEDLTNFNNSSKDKFDYIIAHGVLSWVPESVQSALFQLCKEKLNTNGLAFISYNTLPGWNAVRSLRDMMLYHTKDIDNPDEKIRESKALLNFLNKNITDETNPHKTCITQEIETLSKVNDSYFFHDHLESENHQFYFHEFISKATDHELAYVGDTNISTMFAGNLPEDAQKTLMQINDIVKQEQYMDFIKNRRFRQSIITHKSNTQAINRSLKAGALKDTYIQAKFIRKDNANDDQNVATYIKRLATNSYISVTGKAVIKFMDTLEQAYPQALLLSDSIAAAKTDCSIEDQELLDRFIENNLNTLHIKAFLSFHATDYNFTKNIGDKPVANHYAHYQAKKLNLKTVTNALNVSVHLNELQREIFVELDGETNLEKLIDATVQKATIGKLVVKQGSKTLKTEEELRPIIPNAVQSALEELANSGLLVE